MKCPGKKKYHFLLHELYFSANQGGARTPAGTYLGAATEYQEQILLWKINKILVVTN
jgi:hypothetical protein